MKKRYLKPRLQKAIEVITLLMIMFLLMITDFEVNLYSVLFMFGYIAIIYLNAKVLNKYGR